MGLFRDGLILPHGTPDSEDKMLAETDMAKIRTIMQLLDCKFPVLEGAYFSGTPVGGWTNYLTPGAGIMVRTPLAQRNINLDFKKKKKTRGMSSLLRHIPSAGWPLSRFLSLLSSQ